MDPTNRTRGIAAVVALIRIGVIVRAGRHAIAPRPELSEQGKIPAPAQQPTKAQKILVQGPPPVAPPPRPVANLSGSAAEGSQPQRSAPLPPAPAAGAADVADTVAGRLAPPTADIQSLGRTAVTDKDPERRLEAVVSLSATEDPEAVPFLREALSDPDAGVRMAVVKSLADADFPDDAPSELLATAVTEDSDSENRLEALKVLIDTDREQAAIVAQQALNDSDEDVRALAKQILDPEEEKRSERQR